MVFLERLLLILNYTTKFICGEISRKFLRMLNFDSFLSLSLLVLYNFIYFKLVLNYDQACKVLSIRGIGLLKMGRFRFPVSFIGRRCSKIVEFSGKNCKNSYSVISNVQVKFFRNISNVKHVQMVFIARGKWNNYKSDVLGTSLIAGPFILLSSDRSQNNTNSVLQSYRHMCVIKQVKSGTLIHQYTVTV